MKSPVQDRPRWTRARGDWEPVRLPIGDVLLVLCAMSFQAWVRGLDYGTGNDGTRTHALYIVEQTFPPFGLKAWSALFLTGALVLAGGILLRRHFVVWLGHAVLWITYFALGIGLAVQSFNTPPWFDGIRNATVLTTVIVLHFLMWFRMGPRPRPLTACDQIVLEQLDEMDAALACRSDVDADDADQ